jgi:hypothetical protein
MLTVLLLYLTFAASAMAWRPPTQSQRQVSTVGPWASAGVTIYPLGLSTDILHKVHRKWILASNGTAGEWCVMPRKDQRNLGFPAGALCGT